MANSDLLAAAEDFRAAILAQDAAALARLIRTYGRMVQRLQPAINALQLELEAAGTLSKGRAVRLANYQSLQKQIADELTAFGGYLRTTVDEAAMSGLQLGERHAREMVSVALSGDATIASQFHVLPREALYRLMGFLAEDSPLYTRISELAPFTAERVRDGILEGVGLGRGPRQIALAITDDLGQGLTSALRMTRTVQLYSYREANRASYIANGDVVDGWVWWADLTGNPCMSCVVQHGTLHPVTETLNDHYNGRCAMLPSVRGFPPITDETGADWFAQQSEATQRQMMGKGRYEAWREGKFDLSQMSGERHDDVYGPMRGEVPLKELVGDG